MSGLNRASPPRRVPALISKSEVRRRAKATGAERLEVGLEDVIVEVLEENFEQMMRYAKESRSIEIDIARKNGLRWTNPSLKRRHLEDLTGSGIPGGDDPASGSWEVITNE